MKHLVIINLQTEIGPCCETVLYDSNNVQIRMFAERWEERKRFFPFPHSDGMLQVLHQLTGNN